MLQQIFADTSYFIALNNRQDELHSKAKKWAWKIGMEGIICHTTIPILFELEDGYARLNRREKGVQFIQNIFHAPNFTVHPFDQATYEKALDIYVRYHDKEWGLTDCYSFQLMAEQNLIDALTSDPHFGQYGFNLLLTAS